MNEWRKRVCNVLQISSCGATILLLLEPLLSGKPFMHVHGRNSVKYGPQGEQMLHSLSNFDKFCAKSCAVAACLCLTSAIPEYLCN